MSIDRLAAFERCRWTLGDLAKEADYDPLVLLDLARSLVGIAVREGWSEDRCSQAEWTEALLELAVLLVLDVAGEVGCDSRQVEATIAWRLDQREFEQVVSDGIWCLPEVER